VLLVFAAVGGLKWMAEHRGELSPPPRVVTEEVVALRDGPQEAAPSAAVPSQAAPSSQEVATREGADPQGREATASGGEAAEPSGPAASDESAAPAPSPPAASDHVAPAAPEQEVDLAGSQGAPPDELAAVMPQPLSVDERAVLIRRLLDVYQRLEDAP